MGSPRRGITLIFGRKRAADFRIQPGIIFFPLPQSLVNNALLLFCTSKHLICSLYIGSEENLDRKYFLSPELQHPWLNVLRGRTAAKLFRKTTSKGINSIKLVSHERTGIFGDPAQNSYVVLWNLPTICPKDQIRTESYLSLLLGRKSLLGPY